MPQLELQQNVPSGQVALLPHLAALIWILSASSFRLLSLGVNPRLQTCCVQNPSWAVQIPQLELQQTGVSPEHTLGPHCTPAGSQIC